jgi:hypothetical protein
MSVNSEMEDSHGLIPEFFWGNCGNDRMTNEYEAIDGIELGKGN